MIWIIGGVVAYIFIVVLIYGLSMGAMSPEVDNKWDWSICRVISVGVAITPVFGVYIGLMKWFAEGRPTPIFKWRNPYI